MPTRKDLNILLTEIAERLCGMNEKNLTTAERQISILLVKSGHLNISDNGDLRDHTITKES